MASARLCTGRAWSGRLRLGEILARNGGEGGFDPRIAHVGAASDLCGVGLPALDNPVSHALALSAHAAQYAAVGARASIFAPPNGAIDAGVDGSGSGELLG